MTYKLVLTDGTKAALVDNLPEEAWTIHGATDREGTDIHKLYANVAFLYRCVEMRANAIASLPWYILRKNTEVWSHKSEDVPDELLFAEHLPDLLWQSEASLSLGAQAFWLKEMNRVKLRELRWLTPWSMTPIWTEADGLTKFERQLERKKMDFAPDRIVYLRLPGQHETLPRVAPAEAAMAASGVLYNADTFSRLFFERGAIKATLLTVEGTPLPEERERLKNWWKRVLGGIGRALNVEVVSAGVKPVIIGDGISELGNSELAKEKREDIGTAMGVPNSLLVSSAANYATAQVDYKAFYDLTVVPESVVIQRQVNRQLFNDLGYRFEFRPQELDVYQTDENERSESFERYVNAGIKRSVAAQMLGLELPSGLDYEDLDPEPQPQPQEQPQPQAVTMTVTDTLPPEVQQASPSKSVAPDDDEPDMRRDVEVQVFRRWYKKRKHPDVAKFGSDILTDADKAAIAAEIDAEDAAGTDAFFRVEWQSYP